MSSLVPVDIAIRRSAAACKAWETRRAQGWVPAQKSLKNERSGDALAAFEREAASDNPDWHAAALELRRALVEGRIKRPAQIDHKSKVRALPAPVWHDYPVDKASSWAIRTDVLVVTFADGEVVRAPAVSIKGRPTNIGRGLRIAVAFYQARACRRRGIKFRTGVHEAVPAIASCVCEDSGETFDPGICTVRTQEDRKAQNWRIVRQPDKN